MYNVSREQVAATIPGSEKLPNSTDLSNFPHKFMDVPYANGSSAQRLNLVLPNVGEAPFPLVVYIHGGGWLIGDKNHVQTKNVYRLLYAGYAVCCIDYRLSDEAKWPENLYDCKAAIRFLRANAEKFQISPGRIGVVGNSAGGHLAAMLGTTNGKPEFEDLSMGNGDFSSDVQAVFTWFAPYDFVNWVEDFKKAYPGRPLDYEVSAEAYMFGHSLLEHPERLEAASPICQLDQNTVPFYVEYGTGDHAIPHAQCPRFYERYVQLLGEDNIQIRAFEGAEHSAPVYAEDGNVFEFVRFFDRYIRQTEPRPYFQLGTLGEYDSRLDLAGAGT